MRTLSLADLPAILALQAECYAADYLEPEAAFAAKLQGSPETCWGVSTQATAEVGGALQAYLIGLPVHSWHGPALHASTWSPPAQPRALYLHDLALHPSTRGQGVGQALVAHAEAWARARGLAALCLMAVQGSTGYWARQGFTSLHALLAEGALPELGVLPGLAWGQASQGAHMARDEVVASYGPGACLMAKALVPTQPA